MSLLKAIRAQLGLSASPAQNFTLDASAADGTMKLARGNAGATTQDIFTVAGDGRVDFPAGLAAFLGTNQSLGTNGYQKLPGGLIIQWGYSVVTASTINTIALPLAWPNSVLSLVVSSANGDSAASTVGVAAAPATPKTTFRVRCEAGTSGVIWIAIGY